MQAVGVIAEFNPFHMGHAWLLGEIRRRFGEDCAIVCAMSGNYTQRGDCAILRKHVRAEAAVRSGADLVLEIPLPWAISSAEGFASGGVQVLAAAGVVDALAFGSECADTSMLMRTAEALLSERFQDALREELDAGDSFASARQRAAETVGGGDAWVLSAPNDILGVEYCKSLRQADSPMEPLAIARIGASHDGAPVDGVASASYIRRLLIAGQGAEEYLAPEMSVLYEKERAAGRAPVELLTLERAVLARLRGMGEEEFASYDEGGEGLYHRFFAASRSCLSIEELLNTVKTKRYAHARLRRMLLAVFLGLRPGDRPEHIPYIRVLAMNDKGKCLLHRMRGSAVLPVLIKPASVRRLSDMALQLFQAEARATDLYALAYPSLSESAGGGEWSIGPVQVQMLETDLSRRA